MYRLTWLALLICLTSTGCGPAPSVIPTDPLTEEQKKAIQEEDRRTEMEESQGSIAKPKTGSGKK